MGLLGRDKVAFNWIQSLDTMVSGHVDGTQIGRAHEIAVCTRALLLTCFWGSVGDLWGGLRAGGHVQMTFTTLAALETPAGFGGHAKQSTGCAQLKRVFAEPCKSQGLAHGGKCLWM